LDLSTATVVLIAVVVLIYVVTVINAATVRGLARQGGSEEPEASLLACPNACAFCTVSTVAGRKYRFRPVEEVVEEVRPLGGWVGFVDDNITGHPQRAKELFEALIPLKLRWVGQADLSLAKDPELMALAVRSGCQALFIGLESLSQENLRATRKRPNVGTDMCSASAIVRQIRPFTKLHSGRP
jgi:hypothetical protein